MSDEQKKSWWQEITTTAYFELLCTIVFMVAYCIPWLITMANGETSYEFRPYKIIGTEATIMFYVICLLNIVLLIKYRISWVTLIIFLIMVLTLRYSEYVAEQMKMMIEFWGGFVPLTGQQSGNGSIAIINIGYGLIFPFIAIFCTLTIGWFMSALDIFKRKDESISRHIAQMLIGLAILVMFVMFLSHKFKGVENLDDFMHRFAHLSFPYMFSTIIASVLALMSFCHLICTLFVMIMSQFPKSEEPIAADVEEISETPQAEAQTAPLAAPTPAPKDNNEWWVVGFVFVVVLTLLGVYIIFFSHKTETNKSETVEENTSEEIFCDAEYDDPAELITGFFFKVKQEGDENVLFAVNEYGMFGTGISLPTDSPGYINILDQNDYDGDGEKEAFIQEWTGGNSLPNLYIVYYDKVKRDFCKSYGFPPKEEVDITTEHEDDKIYIVIKEGILRTRYKYFKHDITIIDSKTTIDISNPIATLSVHDVFGDDRPDEAQENKLFADIDGDGDEETLTFYRDDSAAFDFGGEMQLNMIGKNDGTLLVVGVSGDPIVFLHSKTNGMPDIVTSSQWLYKWDGDDYKLQQ